MFNVHSNSIQRALTAIGGGYGRSTGQDELRNFTEGFRIKHRESLVSRLQYDPKSFQQLNERTCGKDMKQLVEFMNHEYPEFCLYEAAGFNLDQVGQFQRNLTRTKIYRLMDRQGFCFDFEIVKVSEGNNDFRFAHVKFIVQPNLKKQGQGYRCKIFIQKCADILFNSAFMHILGTVIGENQYKVRETRNSNNWRTDFVDLKNYWNEQYENVPRLLGFYLRTGWVLQEKAITPEPKIMFLSEFAKDILWEESPETFKEKYKFYKYYENEIEERRKQA